MTSIRPHTHPFHTLRDWCISSVLARSQQYERSTNLPARTLPSLRKHDQANLTGTLRTKVLRFQLLLHHAITCLSMQYLIHSPYFKLSTSCRRMSFWLGRSDIWLLHTCAPPEGTCFLGRHMPYAEALNTCMYHIQMLAPCHKAHIDIYSHKSPQPAEAVQ